MPPGESLTIQTKGTIFFWILSIGLVTEAWAFAASAGRRLVVDDAQPSDVILVLAGETDRRPARALQLLDQGYGRQVVIDVPAATSVFGFTQVELAQKYIENIHRSAVVG